jgi:hypothetical protein
MLTARTIIPERLKHISGTKYQLIGDVLDNVAQADKLFREEVVALASDLTLRGILRECAYKEIPLGWFNPEPLPEHASPNDELEELDFKIKNQKRVVEEGLGYLFGEAISPLQDAMPTLYGELNAMIKEADTEFKNRCNDSWGEGKLYSAALEQKIREQIEELTHPAVYGKHVVE